MGLIKDEDQNSNKLIEMQSVPESFGSVKEDCGSLKNKLETGQIKVY